MDTKRDCANRSAVPEMSAADANRLFYAEYAERYEEVEECVLDRRAQALLRDVLSKAVAAAPAAPGPGLRTLDACGGTGNASFVLIRDLGVDETTVADISPEMLARCAARAAALGASIHTIETEIQTLLETSDPWDLIVFSSALHHLDDYQAAVELAYGCLSPGGVFVTIFDPVAAGKLGWWVRRIDWLLGLLIHAPTELIRIARRRFTHRAPTEEPCDHVGRLAERHALSGIDDRAIIRSLTAKGGELLEYARYAHYRLAVSRWVATRLSRPSAFHLIARRPVGADEHVNGAAPAATVEQSAGRP